MKMDDDINEYVPSVLNPRGIKKQGDIALTQCSLMSRTSLSLKRNNGLTLKPKPAVHVKNCILQNKENSLNIYNISPRKSKGKRLTNDKSTVCDNSLGFSAIEDLATVANNLEFSPSIIDQLEPVQTEVPKAYTPLITDPAIGDVEPLKTETPVARTPLISLSSATELDQLDSKSDTTVFYDVTDKPTISVSFGVNFCNSLDVNTKNSAIKRILVSHNDMNTTVDCEIVEGSKIDTESQSDMEEVPATPRQKRSAVAVNFEIKKRKVSEETAEDTKILILNASAIEKISHVIVQPPNYKIVKGKISDIKNTFKNRHNSVSAADDGIARVKLKQKSIDSFFAKCSSVLKSIKVSEGRSVVDNGFGDVIRDEMSKNSGVADAIRSERVRKSPLKGSPNNNESAHLSGKSRKDSASSRQEIKTTCSSPRGRRDSTSSQSPRKNVDSIHFSLPPKSVSNKRTSSTRTIPNHKIVAGTHFAVDAFSYGEIPNVKHYFLTHFHSDHYSGLKKGFNKLLFCSKITADLCISRLGVSPKCIHVVNVDETIRVEGVEVTALEANHCPGALMLVFTLPNGKTLLHTGDFRASPVMESYPVFWNKDIHTIYLDTTYCNPRYDFPTQEQSLEMALYILRQKKLALEKIGKKFSSVLIVCGTYTIGKEKFFLGMSRRVGCSVWACPEKERVLQALAARGGSAGAGGGGGGGGAGAGAGAGAGGGSSAAPPNACQLHVVPMRDLTHEKLRSYLDSLKGAFAEVVAFKPSGWENGKTASIEKDSVTIHGIPYSEHSSFSELIRFVKFLKPKQVVPTVDISGGVRAVQKYFPCPLVYKEDLQCQSKVTDFFSIQNQPQVPAVT